MRVKVEDDEGTLLALLVVNNEPDANGIVGWELLTPGHNPIDGNIWDQRTSLRNAAHSLETSTKAHRGPR